MVNQPLHTGTRKLVEKCIAKLTRKYTIMQDPNEDTEWNDVLRAKGIIPPKEKELTEDDLVNMLEQTIERKAQGKAMEDMNREELAEIEDDIDEEEERLFEEYRRKRMQELMEAQQKSRFGDVREISKEDWVAQVNKAGEEVWVVVHVYKPSVPLCKMINEHLYVLAQKFPQTKFLKSVSSVCIPNYPDRNLPTIFIYKNDSMTKQFIGAAEFGASSITLAELEWNLSVTGAFKTDMESAPRPQVRDVMDSSIRDASVTNNSDDEDDW